MHATSPGSEPRQPARVHPDDPTGAPTTWRVIDDPDELAALGEQWARLRTDVPGPTTQLGWVVAQARAIPPGARLCAVTTFVGDRLTAVAPLSLGETFPRRLTWLDTDINGALYTDEGQLDQLARAIHALRRPLRVDALVPGSPTERALRARRPRGWATILRPWLGGPSLPIDPSWDDPLAKLGKKRRAELRRTARKAGSLGEVVFDVLTPPPGAELDELFDEFVRLESSGWKGDVGTALAQDRQQREGLHLGLSAAAAAGTLRITRMRIGDTTAAMHLNVAGGARLWGLKGAVNEDHKAVTPGHHLFAFTIRTAAAEGLERFEFLGATAPFKEMWGAPAVELLRYRVYPPNPHGLAALVGDLTGKAMKELSRRYRAGRARSREGSGARLRHAVAALLPPAMLAAALRTARRVRNASWAGWRAGVRRRAQDATDELSATSCLVLAPHPDDETLGCAATIGRKRAAGSSVVVVVATDGAGGPLPRGVRREELRGLRHRELLDACGRIGVPPTQVVRLDHPDGALADHHATLVSQLHGLLDDVRPDEVLVTWRRDPHPDHRALSAAVDVALRAHPTVRHLEYPIHAWVRGPWTDGPTGSWGSRTLHRVTERFRAAPAGRVLRVRAGRFLDTKRSAVAAYASQFTDGSSDATWGALGTEFVAPFLSGSECFFLIEHGRRARGRTSISAPAA